MLPTLEVRLRSVVTSCCSSSAASSLFVSCMVRTSRTLAALILFSTAICVLRSGADDDTKRQQLEAVQRWYFDDWMGLERKLRSSIVEGVSIFLSLFDINPAVKRVFCPPKQTYDLALNKPNEHGVYPYGRPLPSFNWLIEQG